MQSLYYRWLALSVIASDATSPKGRGWPCYNNKKSPLAVISQRGGIFM